MNEAERRAILQQFREQAAARLEPGESVLCSVWAKQKLKNDQKFNFVLVCPTEKRLLLVARTKRASMGVEALDYEDIVDISGGPSTIEPSLASFRLTRWDGERREYGPWPIAECPELTGRLLPWLIGQIMGGAFPPSAEKLAERERQKAQKRADSSLLRKRVGAGGLGCLALLLVAVSCVGGYSGYKAHGRADRNARMLARCESGQRTQLGCDYYRGAADEKAVTRNLSCCCSSLSILLVFLSLGGSVILLRRAQN